MKIAVASDDCITVNHHFGRAPYYVVAMVQDGKVVSKESRAKSGHHTFAGARDEEHVDGQGRRGYSKSATSRHTAMAESIKDCNVLICGGMGWGAYESMKSNNINTVVTDIIYIDDAIASHLAGTLTNLMDRLH
ncbi:NifB/NifX family molybdenum-iron cluster-binding protein [Chloroflexota bacterium]